MAIERDMLAYEKKTNELERIIITSALVLNDYRSAANTDMIPIGEANLKLACDNYDRHMKEMDIIID